MNSAPGYQPQVVLNGRLLAAGAALISPLGEGFMHGLGLFETIKVLRGRPVFFPEHFERLRRSAGELGLPFTTASGELHARCLRCAAANGLDDGSLKVVAFSDANSLGELIVARTNSYSDINYKNGFALRIFSEDRRAGGISGLKTLNYLKNLRAKQAAQAAGGDEALFIDAEGLVLEGAMSSVFVVKGGEVLTPLLDGRILPGIARSRVLQRLAGGRARECAVTTELLFGADEVFVTNALLGVMPVASVDQQGYDLSRNPVTKSLMESWRKLQLQSVGEPP
ncbi:MAG TPA: aminotransferase class IV [Opitutaceae bacterium]|jgi:branched-subunit amino acid aminotransferase/4-amino-4-deoxychorismate lyase|nr:aminotransferase class IV [Opitutaceae bacterium]